MKTCGDWLRGKLADGEIHLCDDIRRQARNRGFTQTELKQARKAVGVKTFHLFDEEGATSNWYWYL